MQNKISGTNFNQELFYPKILLFGEYSIIFDSMALSIPFGHFTAGFSFLNRYRYTDHNFAIDSNASLREYSMWLEKGELKGLFDIDAFKRDIDRGMFLESNIPQGYGLGSSAVLVAAVYNRYALERLDNDPSSGSEELNVLKKIFAKMEAWFHGVSSGIDPLNCYFRRPVLAEPGERLKLAGIPDLNTDKGVVIFLIDTGIPGKTGPLVSQFMKRSKDQGFMDLIIGFMIPAVNTCIRSMMKPDIPVFMSSLKKLSRFQFENMKSMIPPDFRGIWERGLASDDFYLKLCGSGGGGYLLGFTGDMKHTAGILKRKNMTAMPVYRNL
jgi:mevalonate kinase